MVIGLVATPNANAFINGNVTIDVKGAYANDTWTEVSIENITFGYPDFDGDGSWYGLVGVEPNATGCPRDILEEGTNNIWTTGIHSSPGTFTSGPKTYPLNGAFGQRLCFHIVQFRSNGRIENQLVGGQLFDVKPPEPIAGMTTREAVIIAKGKLSKKYGASWKKGRAKKVVCAELTTIFSCKASWVYKKKSRKGTVTVPK